MDRGWRAVLGFGRDRRHRQRHRRGEAPGRQPHHLFRTGVAAEAIQPVGIAITRDRKLAFVALGPANRVAVIDAQSYEILRYLLVGQRVWSLAFNPDQSRVYTTNGVSNDVSVIDVGSLKVLKSIPVGRAPWGVVSRP
jgi:YVTN family beta-propeller protein